MEGHPRLAMISKVQVLEHCTDDSPILWEEKERVVCVTHKWLAPERCPAHENSVSVGRVAQISGTDRTALNHEGWSSRAGRCRCAFRDRAVLLLLLWYLCALGIFHNRNYLCFLRRQDALKLLRGRKRVISRVYDNTLPHPSNIYNQQASRATCRRRLPQALRQAERKGRKGLRGRWGRESLSAPTPQHPPCPC